jgi:GDP-L-fucose synthase
MHFIFDLIRKILRARDRGGDVILWGDGYQRRELVHVGDFTRILLHLADTTQDETVNVGAGRDMSIREFAGSICDIVGYDATQIRYDETRYTGARTKFLRIDKLRDLLPGVDAGYTPLEQGLRETIEWMGGQPDRSASTPAPAARPEYDNA